MLLFKGTRKYITVRNILRMVYGTTMRALQVQRSLTKQFRSSSFRLSHRSLAPDHLRADTNCVRANKQSTTPGGISSLHDKVIV